MMFSGVIPGRKPPWRFAFPQETESMLDLLLQGVWAKEGHTVLNGGVIYFWGEKCNFPRFLAFLFAFILKKYN